MIAEKKMLTSSAVGQNVVRPIKFVGGEELVTTAAPFARGGLSLGLGKRARLSVDVTLGYTLSNTVVRVAREDTVELGRPILAGALYLELSLF